MKMSNHTESYKDYRQRLAKRLTEIEAEQQRRAKIEKKIQHLVKSQGEKTRHVKKVLLQGTVGLSAIVLIAILVGLDIKNSSEQVKIYVTPISMMLFVVLCVQVIFSILNIILATRMFLRLNAQKEEFARELAELKAKLKDERTPARTTDTRPKVKKIKVTTYDDNDEIQEVYISAKELVSFIQATPTHLRSPHANAPKNKHRQHSNISYAKHLS